MHVICHIVLSACSTSKILSPIFTSISKMGGFTASISGLRFSKVACDQIIETTINQSS